MNTPEWYCLVGEVTFLMHGVSWDSVLSWDESRDLSLDLRLSLDLSCPPLAPWRLIFVQSIPLATRDEVLKTEEKCSAFQSFRNILHLNSKGIQNMYIECKLWRLIFTSIFFLCCTHIDICKCKQWSGTSRQQQELAGYCSMTYEERCCLIRWDYLQTCNNKSPFQKRLLKYNWICYLTIRAKIKCSNQTMKSKVRGHFFQ